MALATAQLSKPSSGRIIPHNVHLLNDSYKDSETSTSSERKLPLPAGNSQKFSDCGNPLEMNDNMGTESPGVMRPTSNAGGNDNFRDSLEDNYDERPLSNSSADSRGMDDSPVDDQEKSNAILNAEKQYQDDLKERVRQSFKDLGMEPEGLLKDDPNRDPKSKKRHLRSKRSQDPISAGSGTEDEIDESSDERVLSAYHRTPVARAGSAAGYAKEPSGRENEPSAYSNEPSPYLNEPSAYSNEPSANSNEHEVAPDKPLHTDTCTSEDQPTDYLNLHQDDSTPKEHPSDIQQQIANAAKEYQNGDDLPPAGSQIHVLQGFPSQEVINDSPTQGHGGHDLSDAAETAARKVSKAMPDHYAEAQENMSDERNPSSQEESKASTSYPVADVAHDNDTSGCNEDDYRQSIGYPAEDTASYPNGVTSPEGGHPQPEYDYPSDGPARDGYPKENLIPSGFPSRYANQEYDDDEEQYDGQRQFKDTPQDPELYHETPKDSLDFSQPVVHPHTEVLADSLEYDENDNSVKNNVIPYHHEPGIYPQDSLDLRLADTVNNHARPVEAERHEERSRDSPADNDVSDPAPYDSLEGGEPYYDHNKTPPEAFELDDNINSPPQESKHSDVGPGYQHASNAVQKGAVENGAYSNNSGSSSRELRNEFSARSRKASESRRPSRTEDAGLKDIPPNGRKKTPSYSGSRMGSRASNHPGYADMARRQGSAKHRSAGSDKSSDSDQRQHVGSSLQHRRDSSQALREQNRSRSQSNRMKTSPIPADELSAKELLKRSRTKSDVAREQATVEDSDSQIFRKNGEAVQVAYISDDSGDEGEHFVDEKGSPINHFGKPLYKDLYEAEKKPEEPKLEFRIKPTPPKQKSPLELQAVIARRTSAEMNNGRAPNSGKITRSNSLPIEDALVESTTEVQTGLLDGALPSHYSQNEPVIQKTYVQQEGTNDSTLPARVKDRSTHKEDPEKPGASASKSRRTSGEVKVRSVGTIMSGKSLGRGRTPPVSKNNRENAYDEFQPKTRQHSGRSLSGVEKDFEKPDGYPSVSRGASGGSYQERGSQYTPQEGQSRGSQGYVVQQLYNPHYYPDPNSNGYTTQQTWEQVPHGIPWNNPHSSQMYHQFNQTGLYNQPQPGYDGLHHPDQGQYFDQLPPYTTAYQNYQQPRPMGPPQGYISPSMGVSQVPNQGMQPVPGNYPDQAQTQQRGPPKPKPNFIDLNKANLARGPPRKGYSDIQKQRLPSTRMNPTKPLPNITREGLGYNDDYHPLAGDIGSLGIAQTWADENWTRQLIQEQHALPLRRGHSDTNLYVQNSATRPVQQGYMYHSQGQPIYPMPGPSQDQPAFQPAYNQTYPAQSRHQNGQPYSYSADHATQFARNMGLPHPQISGPPRARVAFADDYHNSFDSDVNPMTFVNEGPGAEYRYQHATKRTSPYPVLPDIPGHDRTDSTSPLRKSDPDSYVARLLKQKEPRQYKEYTIKDYRKLKMDLRLGGLGPDPGLISERQEKVTRQLDYAKVVMDQNKKQLIQQVKKGPAKEENRPKESTPSKREIAKEYAKRVPKPRMPTPPEVLHERMYGAPSGQQAQQESEHEERTASEMLRLEELKARHRKEKEEVERLRVDKT